MPNVIITFLLKIFKEIRNNKQSVGFIFITLIISLFYFGKSKTGEYSFLSVIIILTFSLLFIIILSENFFHYLMSRDWNKNTNDYLKSLDQTKSPAYIASSAMRLNEGKKAAYSHCIKEINSLPKNKYLNILKTKIEGALNSINL